jgi:hypothetical protein
MSQAKVSIDDVEGPLHEIQRMAQFAAGLATDGLAANEAPEGFFQIPTKEGNQLAFCTYDILRRVDELLESISSAAK